MRGHEGAFLGFFLVQHDLAAGDGDGLAGLILLLHTVHNSAGNVDGQTAPVHGDLCLVETADIVHSLGAGYLAGVQVLYKQAALGIGLRGPSR